MAMTKQQEKELRERVNDGERPMKVASDIGISRDDMMQFRKDNGPFRPAGGNGRTFRLVNLRRREARLSEQLTNVQVLISELEGKK